MALALSACGGGGSATTGGQGGGPTPTPVVTYPHTLKLDPSEHVVSTAYSPLTRKLYGACPETGTLLIIDPESGSLDRLNIPGIHYLAISDDGSTLFTTREGGLAVQPIDLPGLTVGSPFGLGKDAWGNPNSAQCLAVLPGSNSSVAVSTKLDGVAIYDKGIRRPLTSRCDQAWGGPGCMVFGKAPDRILGVNPTSGNDSLWMISITPEGARLESLEAWGARGGMLRMGEFICTEQGQVFGAADFRPLGAFPHSGLLAVNSNLSRVYLFEDRKILALDPATFRVLGESQAPVFSADARLQAWGSNGIAAVDNLEHRVVLLKDTLPPITQLKADPPSIQPGQTSQLSWQVSGTPVVTLASQGVLPSGTLRVSPNASTLYMMTATEGAWTSRAEVFVSVTNPGGTTSFPFQVKDMVYSAVTRRLYATSPASGGPYENRLLVIDPESGVIESDHAVGSQPGPLTLNYGETHLFIGLQGSRTIRRMDLSSKTMEPEISLGSHPLYGPLMPIQLVSVPGDPEGVSVVCSSALSQKGSLKTFSRGIERARYLDEFPPLRLAASSARAGVLYGLGFGQVFEMRESGGNYIPGPVRALFHAPPYTQNLGFILADEKLIGDTGETHDALTGDRLGHYSTWGAPCADLAEDRIYFATNAGIQVYQASTYRCLGFLTGTTMGSRLLRFGTNGLALLVDDRLHLRRTTLPTISRFESNPVSVAPGEPVTLSWDVANATELEIDGIGKVSGNQITLVPNGRTTFTLKARSAQGEAKAQALVGTLSNLGVRTLGLPVNDVAYSPLTDRLYAAIGWGTPPFMNCLLVISPRNGALDRIIPVGSDPSRLTISEDGTTLWMTVSTAGALRRLDLKTGTLGPLLPVLAQEGFSVPQDLAILPGTTDSVAVVKGGYPGLAGVMGSGVLIMDNGSPRPKQIADPWIMSGDGASINRLTLSPESNVLFGTNHSTSGFDLYRLRVDSDGVSIAESIPKGGGEFSSEALFSRGKLYYSNGEMLDGTTLLRAGLLPFEGAVCPDAALDRIYVGHGGGVGIVEASTLRPLGTIPAPGPAWRMVLCGDSGLALATPKGLVLVNRSAPEIRKFRTENLKVPESGTTRLQWEVTGADRLSLTAITSNDGREVDLGAVPNSGSFTVTTAVPTTYSLRAFGSEASTTQEVSVETVATLPIPPLGMRAADLVFSPLTNRLYATVLSQDGTWGNALCEIDPQTGAIGRLLHLGSRPHTMSLSDDGRTLHVGLRGDGGVKTIDLLAWSAGGMFGQARMPWAKGVGPLEFPFRVAAMPGHPGRVVLSRGFAENPERLLLYQDGKLLAQMPESPGFGFGILEPTEDGQSLIASEPVGTRPLTRLWVNEEGITPDPAFQGSQSCRGLAYFRDRVYTTDGREIDARTGQELFRFQGIGLSWATAVAVEQSAGRVYFMGNKVLTAFDIASRRLLGQFNLGQEGTRVVPCGTSQVAILGEGGEVFLLPSESIK